MFVRVFRLIAFALALSWFLANQIRAQEIVTDSPGQVQAASAETGEGDESGATLVSSVPFHFSLGVHEGYDDNTRLSGSGNGSAFTKGDINLSYELPNERPHLSLRSGAAYTYYEGSNPGRRNSLDVFLNGALLYPYSERLQLSLTGDFAYRTEPDFSSDVGVEDRRSNFFHMSIGGSAAYHWTPLFSTLTSENFRLVRYDSSNLASFLDRDENTIGQEFRLAVVVPDTTVLALTYRFQTVRYDTFPLDSNTHYLLAGFDQNFNSQLHATFRGGATVRRFTELGSDSQVDPNFETSLTYSGAHNSSLSWTTRYGVEAPNFRQAFTRTTFRTGLALGYDLAARIRGTLALFYHRDENQAFVSGNDFSSDGFDISLGLHYTFSGRLSAAIDYRHSEFSSSGSLRDYSRNSYSGGVTFTY